MGGLRNAAAIILSLAFLTACTQIAMVSDDIAPIPPAVFDPNEEFNRKILIFNLKADQNVFAPAARTYRRVLPETVRKGIRQFLNNLRSPVIFANDLLQGEVKRAGETAFRFAINSSLGGLGFGDPAAEMGVRFHDEDFGQTLAVWGVPEGPYSMAPLLGPSNPRDSAGLLLEFIFDPLNFWAFRTERYAIVGGRTAARGIQRRGDLDSQFIESLRQAFDPYITLRSIHRQRRFLMIRNEESAF